MSVPHYDLAVIGSGPAGQKGAIAAAKLRKKVVVIDRRDMVGGCSLHLGTIPSKTMREAILYLTGIRQRTFYGADYRAKEDISPKDLSQRVDIVLQREIDVVKAQLKRNGVSAINGMARFTDTNTIEIENPEGALSSITADTILIACGTRPAENPLIVTDGERVFNSDQLLHLPLIPRELIVVGGGVIGLEYAAMMTALNTRVTVIDQRPTLLDFADREVIESLCHHLREEGVTFRLGEKVLSVTRNGDRVIAQLESGKTVKGDALLYAVGRQANSDLLHLDAAGIAADARGKIAVNEYFQTSVPHIYAAGDVIGFPALAATSMEQGRLAIAHSLGLPMKTAPHLLPFGIYTIPEISMVGRTEQELTAAKVRYEVGLSRFGELARAQMIGDERGMLKLLFDPDTLRLFGVHVMGESATEIIHIGQAVLSMGGTIDYFRDTVFNYPTLAEAYKVAALNGMNKVA
ncbi:MAG TPA: Si-specific NAD(P)(+) transhydrogenase [Gemmatimonadaceae bacterium]|jgi:NAD(P) transhydrogenase|nr:Si-specific NAD(P)(+) transhydrogenase [Gemmatimonadaceae bacterium]